MTQFRTIEGREVRILVVDGIECAEPWFNGSVSGVIRDRFPGDDTISVHLMPGEALPYDLWIQFTEEELKKLRCRSPEFKDRMVLEIRQTNQADACGRNYEIASVEYQAYTPPDLGKYGDAAGTVASGSKQGTCTASSSSGSDFSEPLFGVHPQSPGKEEAHEPESERKFGPH